MTAPGTQHFTTFTIGKETNAGTSVATTQEWYGDGTGEIDEDLMWAEHAGNRGTRTSFAGVTSKGEIANITFNSDPDIGVSYDMLHKILGQLDGGNSGVAGTSDYTWTIAPSQTGANSQEAYTIEVADDIQAWEYTYAQLREFTLSGSKDSMTNLSANFFARNAVKVTQTAVAANTEVRIPGYLWRPKFATSYAGLAGASDSLNFLQDWSIRYVTGLVPRFYQDGLAYFGQSVEAADMEAFFDFTVESTALAVSEFYDKYRAGTTSFFQLNATGPALGSSYYSAQLSCAAKYLKVQPIGAEDEGVNLYKITGRTPIDPTWANSLGAVIVNSKSAIT